MLKNVWVVWLIIGLLVNVYYLIKNKIEYQEKIYNKKLKKRQLVLGIFLTLMLWPIAIYNNEIRKKK